MPSLALSNIDEYISSSKRTDVIEIVHGEQKRYISNMGYDLTNFEFSTNIEWFNAVVTYDNTKTNLTIGSLTKIDTETPYNRTDMMVVTDAANGVVEFRIPENFVPSTLTVPVDSNTPLVGLVTIKVNTDTSASFPVINKESVLVVIRYATIV